MTETEPAARPGHRPHPRIPLAAAAGAALVVGLVGYAAGHSQGASGRTPAASTSTSACTAVNDALTRQEATAQASPSDTSVQRTTANLIIQNSSCFDPQLGAAAQTLLDKLDQGAAADAVCAASDRPFWDC